MSWTDALSPLTTLVRLAASLITKKPVRMRVRRIYEFRNGANEGPFLEVVVENRHPVAIRLNQILVRPKGSAGGFLFNAALTEHSPKLPTRLEPGDSWRGLVDLQRVINVMREKYRRPRRATWKLDVVVQEPIDEHKRRIDVADQDVVRAPPPY